MFDIETKIGDVRFSQNIINRIAEKAVEDCNGNAILQNYKGGINAAAVELIQDEESYDLKIYIVMKFGASIKKTTLEIIDSVYENAEKILPKAPRNVTVIVTGVLSKNIAKRHIEVSR